MSDHAWYKGNLHTHTTESDGDADPEFVVNWFMEHGYDFLVLSDHNHRTILEHETKGGPLMIPGEEVSARIEFGSIPIHINGIGISRVVEPIHGDDIIGTIQANVDAIHEANGIAQLNHPNFHWAFDHTHIREVRGAELMEVYNGHPGVNLYGAPDKPSTEEIWDGVLSAGRVIFGTATDDSHRYYDYHPGMSNPGRGWVVVRASELTVDAIVDGPGDRRVLLIDGHRTRRVGAVRRVGLPGNRAGERLYLHDDLFRQGGGGASRGDGAFTLILHRRG